MPPPAVTPTDTAVDPVTMRNTMGRFTTGIAVVTTITGGQPYGMTVNSLTSVSLDPPLLLVCLANDARTTQAAPPPDGSQSTSCRPVRTRSPSGSPAAGKTTSPDCP